MEIELPKEYVVEARKGAAKVTVKVVGVLTPEILTKLVLHGLKQKVADAAASAPMQAAIAVVGNKREGEAKEAYLKRLVEVAKGLSESEIAKEAERMMQKVAASLERGEWGIERGDGGTMDKGLVDFVIGKLGKAFEAQMQGFADAKVPDRRIMVDEWLDAKDGRREVYVKLKEEADAEARKAARWNLEDL